ncbi:hypothetical protein GQ85_08525 [Rhodococcus rhodochrous]|nr:hypothetical protein GQ85_08525 [Rhodococcus rhodochrous]
MSNLEDDVARLIAESDIRNTIYRYAVAIDEFDEPGVRSVFADDAVATYWNHPSLYGGDAIADFVNGAADGQIVQHHLLNVYHVDVDGSEAKARVYHTSHQWFDDAPFTDVVMVGRYRMDLRKVQGIWLISMLEMELLWAESRPLEPTLLEAMAGRGPANRQPRVPERSRGIR